ncbi:hypothetical protein GCM10010399_73570 [Dactylosporangium fulvum]|uniref:Excreted virulence factor EspC, type VII ESX diderm n=1 Tax=Dactylosporangium fulvum TaxID=53359 RepID=A0ABY5W2C4_9ACTN|nr:hypothetical protein [Dactylosporangium fulvum]UWP83419.1 hypothetical protein Dfulv_03755 [Dactylosporangium fulvum]
MRLDDLAGRLEAAGDELAGASTTMGLIDPGARTLGGDGAGGLGELGRALHRQLTTAVTARGREAAEHGARLADTAQAVRLVASGYRGADEEARS